MSGYEERAHAKDADPILKPLDAREPTKPGASTGNAYIDRGMQCDAAPFERCYLHPAQRGRVVEHFYGRVGTAYTNYMLACEELRLDEVLAKEPSKGIIFEALLEIVGLVCTSALSKMFKAIQATAERIIAESEIAEQGNPHEWAERIKRADGRAVDQVTRSVVTIAKKHIPAPGDPPTQVGVAFLDMLKVQAGGIYEAIREQAPASCTDDIELLLLLESFHSTHHSIPEIKEQIKGKLDRWKQTQLGDIGTHAEGGSVPQDLGIDPRFPHQAITAIQVGPRDVKLFVVDTFGQKKLGIFRRQFRADAGLNRDHLAAPQMIPPASYDGREPRGMTDVDFLFVAWVADEFRDVAIRSHVANWGDMPGEKTFTPWSLK